MQPKKIKIKMNDDELTHLAKITKRDEALLLELAEKIHNISLLLMPVLAFLGFVVSIELLESGVSSTVIACVAAFTAVRLPNVLVAFDRYKSRSSMIEIRLCYSCSKKHQDFE